MAWILTHISLCVMRMYGWEHKMQAESKNWNTNTEKKREDFGLSPSSVAFVCVGKNEINEYRWLKTTKEYNNNNNTNLKTLLDFVFLFIYLSDTHTQTNKQIHWNRAYIVWETQSQKQEWISREKSMHYFFFGF